MGGDNGVLMRELSMRCLLAVMLLGGLFYQGTDMWASEQTGEEVVEAAVVQPASVESVKAWFDQFGFEGGQAHALWKLCVKCKQACRKRSAWVAACEKAAEKQGGSAFKKYAAKKAAVLEMFSLPALSSQGKKEDEALALSQQWIGLWRCAKSVGAWNKKTAHTPSEKEKSGMLKDLQSRLSKLKGEGDPALRQMNDEEQVRFWEKWRKDKENKKTLKAAEDLTALYNQLLKAGRGCLESQARTQLEKKELPVVVVREGVSEQLRWLNIQMESLLKKKGDAIERLLLADLLMLVLQQAHKALPDKSLVALFGRNCEDSFQKFAKPVLNKPGEKDCSVKDCARNLLAKHRYFKKKSSKNDRQYTLQVPIKNEGALGSLSQGAYSADDGLPADTFAVLEVLAAWSTQTYQAFSLTHYPSFWAEIGWFNDTVKKEGTDRKNFIGTHMPT